MDVRLDCPRRGLRDPILLVDVTLRNIIQRLMADDTGGKLSDAHENPQPLKRKKKKNWKKISQYYNTKPVDSGTEMVEFKLDTFMRDSLNFYIPSQQ